MQIDKSRRSSEANGSHDKKCSDAGAFRHFIDDAGNCDYAPKTQAMQNVSAVEHQPLIALWLAADQGPNAILQ
jgi:hypothetical protein